MQEGKAIINKKTNPDKYIINIISFVEFKERENQNINRSVKFHTSERTAQA